MATLEVRNLQNQKVSTIEVDDRVFGIEPNAPVVHQVVVYQLAKRRAGTVATKTRSFVSGGGAKPYKQKGTGRARRGSSRSPLIVGGGTMHGPQPRSHAVSCNKKVRKLALRSVLSSKVKESGLVVLDHFNLSAVKTKAVAQALKALGAGRALIVDDENPNLALSARNIEGVQVLPPFGVNVYDVMRFPKLVVTAQALRKLEAALKPEEAA